MKNHKHYVTVAVLLLNCSVILPAIGIGGELESQEQGRQGATGPNPPGTKGGESIRLPSPYDRVVTVNPGTTAEEANRLLGEPEKYFWGAEQTGQMRTFEKANLPEIYIAQYPQGIRAMIQGGRVAELRSEEPGPGFIYRGKLRLGSTLEEVLRVVGPPSETVEGKPLAFSANVLYKDVEGRKGFCYYSRPDQNVRFFFRDYKVAALYVPLLDADVEGTSRNPSRPASNRSGPRGYIGIGVKMEGGWLAISGVASNSAANRAGLRGGERILKIDGKSTENKPMTESGTWLAGAPGEKVTLTLLRPDHAEAQPFEVKLVREARRTEMQSTMQGALALKREWTLPPTKEAGPVEWKGNKIVSRVLPYPDFISLFIRLPIAHAVATGQRVKVAVLQPVEDKTVPTLVQNVAPRAEIVPMTCGTNAVDVGQLAEKVGTTGCRVALVPELCQWPATALVQLARQLVSQKVLVVIPSDVSEEQDVIDLVNKLQEIGVLTVGRVNRQSTVIAGAGDESEAARPFNQNIRAIHTDVFSTAGLMSESTLAPMATAAGVAALVVEKWPELSATELREKIIAGARPVWQGTPIAGGRWGMAFSVDPITTRYVPKNEEAIFRFRVLDAAGALGVDTEIPWFLNMLNCPKAWEITKGQGTVVVMTDQGFHLQHPDLIQRIQRTMNFGPITFESPDQNFHGTDMSRILLAVAPEAKIVPVLCSGKSFAAEGDLADNIAKSFQSAAELKADVVSASWAGWFGSNEKLLASVRQAVDTGVVVSWFHYPRAHPGLLRSGFTYAVGWENEQRLGFADRFLTDPPGFHPVEIEAGLSGTAPQAAGIAALIKSVNPKLTPRQVEELMVQNATPIGGGILIPDAFKIVLAARERTAPKSGT